MPVITDLTLHNQSYVRLTEVTECMHLFLLWRAKCKAKQLHSSPASNCAETAHPHSLYIKKDKKLQTIIHRVNLPSPIVPHGARMKSYQCTMCMYATIRHILQIACSYILVYWFFFPQRMEAIVSEPLAEHLPGGSHRCNTLAILHCQD